MILVSFYGARSAEREARPPGQWLFMEVSSARVWENTYTSSDFFTTRTSRSPYGRRTRRTSPHTGLTVETGALACSHRITSGSR